MRHSPQHLCSLQIGGWACRYDPCVASADTGDHSIYIHGHISSPGASVVIAPDPHIY
jgi:hypothetical protein